MASCRLITVIGATGNQGSGIIETVLAVPTLKAKYALRGVTRDLESEKARAMAQRGVEMVKADLNDIHSLKAAMRGAYGAFGMTDFWAVHSQEKEMQQGKNIFEACKAEGVSHYVYSSLPYAEKITEKVLDLPYYDGKAMVQEYIEANKGDMIASYIKPAMFLSFIFNLIRKKEGTPTMIMPFPSDSIAWPFVDPKHDGGKWIMGLFEGGSKANGVFINAVSCWTTPKDLVAALSKESGREVVLKIVSPEVFAQDFPPSMAGHLTQSMRMIGEYSLYGKDEVEKQPQYDQWLVEGGGKALTLEQGLRLHGPWNFETTGFFDILAAQHATQQSAK